MNKNDLIKKVQEVVHTKKEAEDAVNKVFLSIKEAMVNGENITLVGFGTFKIVKKAARKGRNPKTGEEINIPAKTSPKFMPGKALKESMK